MKIDLKKATLKIKDGSTNELTVKIGSGNLSFSEKAERKYTKNYGALHTVRNGDQQALEVNFDFVWEWLRASIRPLVLNETTRAYTLSGYAFTDVSGTYRYTSTPVPPHHKFTNEHGLVLRPLVSANGWIGSGATTPDTYIIQLLSETAGTYTKSVQRYTSGVIQSGTVTVFYEDLTPYEGVTPTILESLKQQGAAAGWVTAGAACEPYCVNLELEYDPGCAGVEKETIVLPKFRFESLDHDSGAGSIACSGKCLSTESIVTRG